MNARNDNVYIAFICNNYRKITIEITIYNVYIDFICNYYRKITIEITTYV